MSFFSNNDNDSDKPYMARINKKQAKQDKLDNVQKLGLKYYYDIIERIPREEIKIFENSKNYFRDFIWVEDVAKTIYHFMYNNYNPEFTI